uniref:Venom S1 protease with CUB domain 10 n=1 Tax=Platymeris rhadamanthus TaxID=1134088 RepID=A0A6B9L6L3_PLARH|nr:venom S1 protease with CUB domain 10 [Platymeris rhadamanthus]
MMLRCTIVLLALLAISQAYEVIQVNLVAGLEPYLLMNPNYPSRSEPLVDITWVMDTQSPAKISIHCVDFRFIKSEPCRESYVIINEGQPDEETLCGSHDNFMKISQTSRMALRYLGGKWGGGSLKCVVQATTSDNVYHYQGADPTGLDSSEAGLINRPGRRSTSCKCGWVNKSPARIYGGREVSPHEYPWLVALVRGTERRMPFCGGSIITQYHVLTAAHCVVDTQKQYSVMVGEYDWQDDNNRARQLIKVKDVILYQNYSSYIKDFDIAILNLENEIQFNELVGPVCLPNGRLDVRDQWLKVMGWGRVDKEYFSTIAKVTYLKGVDINICSAKYYFLMITEDPFHICTWAKNTDSCRGDSGGPLVWLDPDTNRYTQSALVSHSISCAGDAPSVNTDVSYFLDWIHLEIRNSNPRGVTCSKV